MEQVPGPGGGAVPGPGLLAAVVGAAGTVGAHGSLWSQVTRTWEGVREMQSRQCLQPAGLPAHGQRSLAKVHREHREHRRSRVARESSDQPVCGHSH